MDRLGLYLLLLLRHQRDTETVAREGLVPAETLPEAELHIPDHLPKGRRSTRRPGAICTAR
jgi:hypothetical protein